MKSRYDEREAQAYVERYAGAWGEPLARRVYTSRLIGADPALVLHGGGNTSVKAPARDAVDGEVEVLYVKGSGWDLASIEPAGFPAVRLAHLRKMLACERLSDEEMVNQQRTHLLDYRSPNPSVEALLHALLPQAFVDHTHADAILALTDQPDGVERARALFGPRALVLEYTMPGFVLAKVVRERLLAHPDPTLLVLAQHGIFSFGATARESYERMIDAVDAAERAVTSAGPVALGAPTPKVDEAARRRAGLALRGALAARGMRAILVWCRGDDAAALAQRGGAAHLAVRGPVTPDHVLRTKPWPLLLSAAGEGEALPAHAAGALDEYAQRYRTYVEEGVARVGPRAALDPLPRVAVVHGVGICTWGPSRLEADAVREIVEHTAATILRAEAIGTYRPITREQIFDMEYWSLEQAKVGGAARPAALAGRIVVVTGAAGGIGLATAKAFALAGAHLMLADRDARALHMARESLSNLAPQVETIACDVTERDAGRRIAERTCDAFGGLDVVVSNAGNAPSGLLHTDEGDVALERSLEVNFLAHQRLARAALEVFIAQRCGGVLLFNLSKQTFAQSAGFGPYGVAKTAALALMRQYAIDGAAYGVRANGVNADRVRTALFTPELIAARAAAHGISSDAYFAANALHREVTGEDVAQAFLHLALAEATTGCVLTVDGGVPAAFPR